MGNRFVTRLAVVQLDGKNWKLLEPLEYLDDELGMITAPKDFHTDGGSVPPAAQGFINPFGAGFRAFVIHDYLYATQKFTREQSDDCLRRALEVCGENWFDGDVQWRAVRDGGEAAWKDDQNKYAIPQGERHE